MWPSVLLLALAGAPALGSALRSAAARISPNYQALRALALPIGAGLAFAAGWLLMTEADWQIVVGGWLPVSLTGSPLALAGFPPAHGLLIAWIAAYAAHLLSDPPTSQRLHPSGYAFFTAALLLVAFAGNLITLLVGLGLVDLFTLYYLLRRGRAGEMGAALLGLALKSLAVLALAMVGAVHAANGGSLHLPVARLLPSTAPILALAAALRLGVAPFRLPVSAPVGFIPITDALSAFFMLMHLPRFGITALPSWFYILTIISALLHLLLRDPRMPHRSVVIAGAHLAALSIALAAPGAVAAAASAWLLGITLIDPSTPELVAPRWAGLATRLLGAACLVGLPLSVGFVGQAGLLSLWTGQNAMGWLLAASWIVTLAVLVDALIDLVAAPSGPSAAPPWRWWMSRAVLLIPVALFSLLPTLLGAGTWGELLARRTLADGLPWLLAIALGIPLWWIRTRRPASWSALRTYVAPALGLDWLHALLTGTMRRASRPFQLVFTVLEGDGVLAWAAIIALVLILLARAGGP
jgi:hypothetical protein